MFPLSLLSIAPDDLASLDPRLALRYQNTFMKNALIRGLNVIYLAAPIINDGDHPKFREFMGYIQMVCEMMKLHFQGDEAFFTTLNSERKRLTDILGEGCTLPSTIGLKISSLDEMIHIWNKCPSSYTPYKLREFLELVEEPIMTGMRKQVESIKGEDLVGEYSEDQMRAMIEENMIWLAAQSDVSILLP